MNATLFLRAIAAAAVGAFAAACTLGGPAAPESGEPDRGPSSAVTFHRDVAPILDQHCRGCHVEGGVAPFALGTYAQTKGLAGAIVAATQAKIMPPWGAHDSADCKVSRPWKNDQRLSDAELATLKTWSEIGAPEGDPADAPPPRAAHPLELPGATTYRPDVGYAMSGTVDQLRCFVIDPKLANESWVTGTAILPDRREVVHHVLVYADPNGDSSAKVDANGQYECFGGPGFDGARLLMAWAPGGPPSELPPDVGIPVEAGAKLVMQVHYHAAPGLSAPPDRTSVQLRFASQAPRYAATTLLLGNFDKAVGDVGLMPGPDDPNGAPAFVIPPNASNHTETMRVRMPAQIKGRPASSFRLLTTGAHMHYVGVAEDIRVKRASGGEECLLSIPHWDFDWQRGYEYDVPLAELPTLQPNDEISIRCTYENTMKNPKMPRILKEAGLSQPVPVLLGESTLEEMCIGIFVFVVER